MLPRAARKNISHNPSPSLNPSYLRPRRPFLSPAQLRWSAHVAASRVATAANPSSDRIPAKLPQSIAVRREHRNLSTAADAFVGGNAVPFEHMPSPRAPLVPRDSLAHRNPDLHPLWDPSSQLVIHESIATFAPPVALRAYKGTGGNAAEIISNLNACIRVGRYDRGASLLLRLGDIYSPDAEELLEGHNLYLRGMINGLSSGKVDLKKIQYWFEVRMVQEGVEPDATSFVHMYRASFRALGGKKQERALRRYLHMAEERGLLIPSLYSTSLSEKECQYLTRIRSDLFHDPDSGGQPDFELDSAPIKTHSTHTSTEGHFPPQVSPSPAVNPVEQKGLGLETLKHSLHVLEDPSCVPYPHHLHGTKAEKDKAWAYARQACLEENVVLAAIERWRMENEHMKKMGISTALQTEPMEALIYQWHVALEASIREEFKLVQSALENDRTDTTATSEKSIRQGYGPFLELLDPEKLAAITIIIVLNRFVRKRPEEDGVKVAELSVRLGSILEAESTPASSRPHSSTKQWGQRAAAQRGKVMEKLFKKKTQASTHVPEPHAPAPLNDKSTEQLLIKIKQEGWPDMIKAQIGALLLSKLIEIAKISAEKNVKRAEPVRGNEIAPAFFHSKQHRHGRKVGMVMAHPMLMDRLSSEPMHTYLATHLPMLVEPEPWEGLAKGGFLKVPTKVIRQNSHDDTQLLYATAAIEKGDMDQVFAGLDILGRTPWRINRNVFDVMVAAWNTGESIASFPAENMDMPIPPEPTAEEGPLARRQWLRKLERINDEKSGYHSQRCFANFQLEVARSFLNETFYYPHNIDFRGRAYPVPPYLNHMGADNARGVLIFGKGKELGSSGLTWLKIHLANVFGFDKASLKEREEFSMEHLDDIRDSVQNPLDGRRWWLKAEDPWQCLAACFELKNALDSPDPTRFVSHLPVHQDGTCNGLQHYAALGGDELGAAQVNLVPGDRPADIYTAVSNLVKEEVAKDLATGHELAIKLQGNITRKVVKQTVMTNVYGVTFVGARDQVLKQLDDIMPENRERGPTDNYRLSSYVAKIIFKALASMFNGAHNIQYWLGECASRISTAVTPEQIAKIQEQLEGKTQNIDRKYNSQRKNQWLKSRRDNHITSQFRSSVIWTTPLKMPVVQPYRTARTKLFQTKLQGIHLKEPSVVDCVAKRKQLQAFPPNFVHSLDATHMILSALKSDELGLTFAAVHDSFWTHAGDIPTLNKIIRDAFIRMHSEDIIGRLAAEFDARYKNGMYLASVYAKSEAGMKIRALRVQRRREARATAKKVETGGMSDKSYTHELLEEYTRQQLLRSEDAEERKKGEGMVTPCSIVEATPEVEFELPKEIQEARLGAVPDELKDAPNPGETSAAAKVHEEAHENMAYLDPENEEVLEEVEEVEDIMKAAKAETDAGIRKKLEQELAEKRRWYRNKVLVWLPLKFPPKPARGDFDVNVLRDSQYFFS
ncbi:DNA/RNA polymerase [Aulographum hederae CBS 113979]|uniref:DNA-directed RNA polymerase n=1 Tax=Aulographum hederae CBS 113979 TaxID=1176131 RepID=A0A6G1GWB2_9PEZI|nr:DNA/RNA polymerase [Aulographum hederae CBS 113979]